MNLATDTLAMGTNSITMGASEKEASTITSQVAPNVSASKPNVANGGVARGKPNTGS